MATRRRGAHGLQITGDACQAEGLAGTARSAAAHVRVQLLPREELGAMGDAGALVTDDEALAAPRAGASRPRRPRASTTASTWATPSTRSRRSSCWRAAAARRMEPSSAKRLHASTPTLWRTWKRSGSHRSPTAADSLRKQTGAPRPPEPDPACPFRWRGREPPQTRGSTKPGSTWSGTRGGVQEEMSALGPMLHFARHDCAAGDGRTWHVTPYSAQILRRSAQSCRCSKPTTGP